MNPVLSRAVILCPGPSLANFIASGKPQALGEIRIGVNRAAEAVACSWMVAADAEAAAAFEPIGTPALFTTEQSAKRLTIGSLAKYTTVLTFDEVGRRTSCPAQHGWRRFSLLAAMVLAEYLYARRIEVYGTDWNGEEDWDGTIPLNPNRTEHRWQQEQAGFDRVTDWLRRYREIAVTRRVASSIAEAPAAVGPPLRGGLG